MANSVFISCAFSRPERTYDAMAAAIEELGVPCVEIHFALWHVETTKSAAEVRERLKPVLDVNDQLVVIDVMSGKVAWQHLPPAAEQRLREIVP